VDGDGRIACPNCGGKVGSEVVGYYRTTCRKCHRVVVWWSAGRRTFVDPSTGKAVEVIARVRRPDGR